jgi:hypothetical protein
MIQDCLKCLHAFAGFYLHIHSSQCMVMNYLKMKQPLWLQNISTSGSELGHSLLNILSLCFSMTFKLSSQQDFSPGEDASTVFIFSTETSHSKANFLWILLP